MAELIHHIPCTACGHTTALLGSGLSQILQCRRLPHTGEPFLIFICSKCKTAFRHDYPQREAAGVIDEGRKTEEIRSQTCFSVVAECADSNCESLVELIAIRPALTRAGQVTEELPTWDLNAVRCEKGHHILPPDPTRGYECLDILNQESK
jgi:hypothetical protein